MFIEQKVAFDVPGERRVHFKVSLLTCSRQGRRLPPGGNTNMVLNGGGKARRSAPRQVHMSEINLPVPIDLSRISNWR